MKISTPERQNGGSIEDNKIAIDMLSAEAPKLLSHGKDTVDNRIEDYFDLMHMIGISTGG